MADLIGAGAEGIKTETTVTKESDTELKRTTVTPEHIIPAETKEEIVTLDSVKIELQKAEMELESRNRSKGFDVAQYEAALAQHDKRISEQQEIVNNLLGVIAAAEGLGIKSAIPVEGITPVEEILP